MIGLYCFVHSRITFIGLLYADFETCGLRTFVDVMTSICVDYLGTGLTCKDITLCTNKKIVHEVLFDTLADNIHLEQNEGFCHKIIRILARYNRFWHYRELAIESIPMMIWNSFAYSSYMKRDITLKKFDYIAIYLLSESCFLLI